MHSKAVSVSAYLKGLPSERRLAIATVRKTVLASLPEGYKETMQYGMIAYVVPLSLYPEGYLGDKKTPLPYAALAVQKNHMALYLMGLYGDKKADEWFRKEYKKSGKKLDMGKSCLRFRKLGDLPLPLIGKAIAKLPARTFIRHYEKAKRK